MSWDGTLSLGDFRVAANFLSEKWKQSNSTVSPWTWVPCKTPPWVSSSKAEGYLSLENMCHLRFDEENHDEGNYVEKEEASYGGKEEIVDNATLTFDQEILSYNFHIVYNTSYRVPVLYFRAYCCNGQPLELDDIEKDLPSSSLKMLKESKWTFITQEEHPYMNSPWYTLHPCGTSEWMKLLFLSDATQNNDGASIKQYLVSWLSVVGPVVGLRIPLDMVNTSSQTTPFVTERC